ncbi:MAG TPA: hypothetical protein VLE44_01965 [Candidatus Saccharimonadales bacterium]|nr:hypothetical protein [Candidatus Saccharimonadales bacterium]
MVQRKITIEQARIKLANKDLNDQQIEAILIKLYSLCETAIDKVIGDENGKN